MINVINGDLFQWDIGRKVKFISKKNYTINEIHFCNSHSDNALVGKVNYEGSVVTSYIPNILLQSDKDLIVYVVTTTEDSKQTVERSVFNIHKRIKPNDYVYTETEIFDYKKSIKELEEKIANVSKVKTVNGIEPDEDGNITVKVTEIPTDEETLEMLAELDIINVVTDVNGDIFTDLNGDVIVF